MNLIKTSKVLGVVLVAVTLIFSACSKGRQLLFTENVNGITHLYITDKRGQGKTDITPALPGGYELSSAQFSSRNKQRIIVTAVRTQEPSTAYFSCNLKGKDVTEIRTFESNTNTERQIRDVR